jgi:DsbC/DsbD-like thiol-disulfide interchange protein
MPVHAFHSAAFAAAAVAIGLATATDARAADASAWQREQHSAARLISAEAEPGRQGTVWRAGVEIAMDPGWKTYWRHPGDSGIPPRFNFTGSRNVRDVEVRWPAPMRFPDGVGMSIGYAERVVLPLRVRPRDPAAAVTLRLKLDYAVCEKLCVPVDASMELALGSTKSPHEELLRASEARVPRKVLIGDEGPLAITAVRREPGAKPRIVVDVRGPDAVDLFADGPNERWSLPLPEPLAGGSEGTRRFAFVLDGLPPGAETAGAQITLTAVAPNGAVEVAFHLD